jgi:hypothetical protein
MQYSFWIVLIALFEGMSAKVLGFKDWSKCLYGYSLVIGLYKMKPTLGKLTLSKN